MATYKYSALTKAYNAWRAFRPKYRVTVGGRTLVIPGTSREAIELASHWHHGWKTALIHSVIAKRPGKFLDIGANIGQTLLDYCDSPNRPGYIGFEPNYRCLQLVSEIIALNHLDDCVITPIGLSSDNSILKLYAAGIFETDTGASIVQELRPQKECQTQWVPCYRFDDIRPSLDLDAISLMKIDVEGAELLVLKGMANTLRELKPWAICEVLLRDGNADPDTYRERITSLMDVIREVGYVAMRINKRPDLLAVSGFTPVEQFPDEVWTYEQAEQCDYLIVPSTDAGQVEAHGRAGERRG